MRAPTVGVGNRPAGGARGRARIDTAIGVAIAAAIALVAPVTLVLPAFAKIERGALWGVVVLIAMAGWGSGVQRLAFPQRRADLGLRLAWGAAALIAVGGLLSLLSLARAPVVLTLLLGGVAWTLAGVVRERREVGARVRAWLRLWPNAMFLVFLAFAALATVQYLAGAAGQYLNANDDQAAYMIFPRKILATGTLLDPFNMRRITAYGGHSFLQALTIIGAASPLQLALLDIGLSLVIVLALLLGTVNDEDAPRAAPPRRAGHPLPADAAQHPHQHGERGLGRVLLPRDVPHGGVGALQGEPRRDGRRPRVARRRGLHPAPVLPGPGGRVHGGPLLTGGALGRSRARRGAQTSALRRSVAAPAGFLLLFLLPWAVLSYRSNRTFLFPLFSGTYHTEYGGFTTHSLGMDRVKFLWLNICHCHPITTLPFFLLAGVLLPARRDNGALRALLWAALIGFVTVVFSLPLSDRWNIARYYYGFCVAAVLATILSAFSRGWRTRTGRLRMNVVIPAVLVLAAIVEQVQEAHGTLHQMYDGALTTIVSASARPSRLDDAGDSYRRLQAAIPAGAPLIVMLDEPFWLDYKRNPINSIDLPGAASPAPGMPLDDDEALVRYLKGQGYRYLAFVRSTSSKSLYRRDTWHKHLTSSTTLEIWRMSAVFYLNTFDRFDGLAKSRLKVFDDGQMVALDLETLVEAAPPEAKALATARRAIRTADRRPARRQTAGTAGFRQSPGTLGRAPLMRPGRVPASLRFREPAS